MTRVHRPSPPKRINLLTAKRLLIKRGGYDVIPLNGKRGGLGWPTQRNDEAAILKWGGLSTGIRMYGHDVFVLDLDVNIAAVVRAILAAYTKKWPAFMRRCLRRHSGTNKIALIGRCNTAKTRKQTARYFAEPDDTGSKGHLVEFFGCNDKRLTAVQGWHSAGRAYDYHGDPIWARPVDTLPWFPDEGIPTALDLAETIMTKHGLVPRQESRTIARSSGLIGSCERVYDLEPDMVIQLADDSEITLAELEEKLYAGLKSLGKPARPVRLAAYANLWEESTTRDRVLIALGSTGLCLWDTKYDQSHRWKHCAPPFDDLTARLDALLDQYGPEWRRP
jgi:hypothetical protein